MSRIRNLLSSTRVRRILVAVFLLLALVAGVRVVDPLSDRPSGPVLDLSESPEEIARDALLQTKYRDFTVDTYVADEKLPVENRLSYTHVSHEKYENTAREHGQWDSREGRMTGFTNPYYNWKRDHLTVFRGESHPDWTLPRSFNEDSLLGCDCISVDRENSSTLVLATNHLNVVAPVSRAINASNRERRVVLVIDKQQKTLKTVRYRYYFENSSSGGELAVYAGKEKYSNWGTTEVKRPSWASYTIEEAMKDLQNEERGSWIGG